MTCSVDGCSRPHLAKRLCSMHYQRMVDTGSTDPSYRSMSAAERFDANYIKSDGGCWRWEGGSFSVDGKKMKPHAYSYEKFVGPIPDGAKVGPTCGLQTCVNPLHLALIVHARTHCLDCGEELVESNGLRAGGTWRPRCRACHAVYRLQRGAVSTARRRLRHARHVCDICGLPETQRAKGRKRKITVDHDHETLALRGFLCSKCNLGIGLFQDSPHLLLAAVQYLTSPPGVELHPLDDGVRKDLDH